VHGDKWGGMGGARVEDYCIMVHVMILQAGRQAGVAGQNKTVHGVFHALMAGQTTVRV
jgi:hypothetical protein